ncbi:hypothetical protein [Chlamydia buteonis]|uniref:Uncharacterized protein n=1 Tax=Chlamydia buteonis TaxID=2494525 RepID=A0ABX8LDM6_9CHLA|nr:hypothetical protein [Chlamydia buteonis]QXE27174.1 hypothetical protein HBN95_03425 [Chlamydia buteonis]QXE27906.1 hypothetical protein JJJ19_04775 [Chlamydia buteonis]
MKDKTDNNELNDFSLENITSRVRARAETNPALFTLTGSTITSTKPIDMNSQNISGVADPKQNSDAVSLGYLQSNYVSKTDPNSGYLSTQGGTMSGNINMNGNSIINVKMPEQSETLRSLNPSAAATVGYVMSTADTVTNNPQINEAVQKISDVSGKVSIIEAALGIPPSQEKPPEEEQPPVEEPAPDTSLFVKISGSTMSGDLDMTNHTVKNVKTPTDSNPKDAANVEYVQSKITTPQIGFLGNTITGQTQVTDYFNWKTTTSPPLPLAPSQATPAVPVSDPDGSPTTPAPNVPKPVLPQPIRMDSTPGSQPGADEPDGTEEPTKTDNVTSTPISDKYLKIEESDTQTIKVLCPGILILSATANWSGNTAANISVILNPSTQETERSRLDNKTAESDTVVYTVSALQSGQNLFFQMPVQQPSDLKLKLNSTTNGTPARAGAKNLNASSWSWQTTLLPSNFQTASI